MIDVTHGGSYKMGMRAVTQWLGLVDGADNHLMTNLWGYGLGRNVTYPGPTFVAQRDVPVSVRWESLLPNAPHLLPVDFSIHMAMPMRRAYERGGISTVVHFHGGHTEAASDGHPEAWFTQRWADKGPTWEKATYTYDNNQEAATLWYHDHALGITRLNVYAGLAGFYLLRDENELIKEGVSPSGVQEIEMVFQDRMFTADGQLFFPSDNPEPAEGFPPPSPTIIAKFDRVGQYVWHCHILSYEDHDMMRPYEVLALGWDFFLGSGQSALITFIVSDVAPDGFYLHQFDDCDNIFMYSTLDIQGTNVPAPAAIVLLGSGLISLAGLRRKARA